MTTVQRAAWVGSRPLAPNAWSDTNPPWALKAGESVDDNLPAGITVLAYDTYSAGGTRDFGATMDAALAASTGPFVVRMPAGVHHLTSFRSTYANAGAGWFDSSSTKRWCGLIGAGADKTTLVLDPGVMTSAQLSDITNVTRSPVQYFALYFDTSTVFLSGLTFKGNLQQSIALQGLTGSCPAPYTGLHIDTAAVGSRVQYCRFQGFATAAKNAPPYELGLIESLHSTYVISRCELDGRLATDIDPAQPRVSGGIMWNYEHNVSMLDSWLHHTRQSGWAQHDHFPSEGSGNAGDTGVYSGSNVRINDISSYTDSWAGQQGATFACSNVEACRKSFTWTAPRFKAPAGATLGHIRLGYLDGNVVADALTVHDPVIEDTTFGGCLCIQVMGYTNNPYTVAFNANGLPLPGVTVTRAGVPLTPVNATVFNASIHTPDLYYVVLLPG